MTDQPIEAHDETPVTAPAFTKSELIVHESTDQQTGEVTKLYGVVIDTDDTHVTVVWLPVTAAALLPHDQVTAA